MCFVWLSEQTVTFALYIFNLLTFTTEVESVYCAVRTKSLYKTETYRSYKANLIFYLVVFGFDLRLFPIHTFIYKYNQVYKHCTHGKSY
jgi:hypothetical protein